MARLSKFTDEQKLQIALDLLAGKLSHAEVCRKYDISSTYAHKLKDRAFEILREGIGRPVGRGDAKTEQLARRVADLEQLAGDQALAIRYLKNARPRVEVHQMYQEHQWSVRRLARVLDEPISTVGRWLGPEATPASKPQRRRPVSDEPTLRQKVQTLADQPRHRTFGYPRIGALLRRAGVSVNHKSVRRIMNDLGLSRPKFAYKPRRPKRVEKMRPMRPNQGWQIDMTSLALSDFTPLFLVTVVDCCTREIVGWTLERRCRAGEWTAAVRMALEARGLMDKAACRASGLVLRSDNGSQPCSKKFVEFLSAHGVRGQYTGYDAPDDNAYVERLIRTIKEEEIWPNLWDTLGEARQALEAYITYYNTQRLHSALDYQTPNEVAAAFITRAAALFCLALRGALRNATVKTVIQKCSQMWLRQSCFTLKNSNP